MQCSDYACIAGVVGVIAYDLWAPKGQTISEACDRYLLTNRLLTELVMALLYLHVSNRIPPRYDPIHRFFGAVKSLRA